MAVEGEHVMSDTIGGGIFELFGDPVTEFCFSWNMAVVDVDGERWSVGGWLACILILFRRASRILRWKRCP